MPKWEYKIINTVEMGDDLDRLEKTLNFIGDENWELSATLDEGDTLIFKRPCFNALSYDIRHKINLEESFKQ